uniref:SREBP regulating gene protein n=1 Tax=Branchiostoma floridae TaxID=7739 RepID=C3ZZC5_BRAFL|eukprot:XP_002586098.1 hypothetical protein BRAFLDRAFT_252331 [Branchiostoma floridae]
MISRRIFRRRWFLALVLGASLLYFLVSVFKQVQKTLKIVPGAESRQQDRHQLQKLHAFLFHWIPLSYSLQNRIHGYDFVSTTAGFVCDREDILVGGCCDVTSLTTRRFTCASCQDNGCCQVYEHCVSCCLQPEKQPLLRSLLDHVPDAFKTLFASVTDHFELCLAKCRTSSQSVQHENSYRDPKAKFCYGADPPHLQPGR